MRNKRFFPGALLLVFSLAIPFPGGGQPKSGGSISIPVAVTNTNGAFAAGLNASAFSLSEGGHDRSVGSVQEVAPLVAGRNKSRVPFVVFDSLNIPDQDRIRKECLQLLSDFVATGAVVSLSEIDLDGLHEVHSVATPNSILASALLQLDDETPFLNRRDQLQASRNTAEDKSVVGAELARLRQFRHGRVEGTNVMGRVLAQFRGLQQMAVALHHAQGRKTVVWLTSNFPVDVNESEDSLTIGGFGIRSGLPVQSASIDYQKTIDLLNESQISLFPVLSKWRRENFETAMVRSQPPSPDTTLGDTVSPAGLHRIAAATGGEVLSDSGTLQSLVQTAEDRCTSYYLLIFQPDFPKNGLKWSSLNVAVGDKSLKVKSPTGLFLFPSK